MLEGERRSSSGREMISGRANVTVFFFFLWWLLLSEDTSTVVLAVSTELLTSLSLASYEAGLGGENRRRPRTEATAAGGGAAVRGRALVAAGSGRLLLEASVS